jgi:hypothetical protein
VPKLNLRFVLLGSALALPVALALALLAPLVRTVGLPVGPTPPPPTILVPAGELPPGPVGLEVRAQLQNESPTLVGGGFLLRLSREQVVGVLTAHSIAIGDPNRPVEKILFALAGRSEIVAESDTLRGRPGRPRTGPNMTVDYVLLETTPPADARLVLRPDPRGGPQPGERVALFTAIGSAESDQRMLKGTVQSATDTAVWVVMDDLFNPGLMSGSPFVSLHTGQAVGMLVAGTLRRNRWFLAMHPVGSLVELAEAADEFPRLADYRR